MFPFFFHRAIDNNWMARTLATSSLGAMYEQNLWLDLVIIHAFRPREERKIST